jgi:prepilin-type N-terminal cleavage/methylation domain-containing protein
VKFFKNNKKALTLIELITSVTISSILFFMVFIFITDSVEELVDNDVKVTSIDEAFSFKDTV